MATRVNASLLSQAQVVNLKFALKTEQTPADISMTILLTDFSMLITGGAGG